jgi:hypothetical protein
MHLTRGFLVERWSICMAITEIRKGLRRLDFTPGDNERTTDTGTHVVVEFEVGTQLAEDQLVLINLGLRNGVLRELTGRPRLVTASAESPPSYRYRLEGDVA